ncbi:probable GTPase-activating protein Gyl1p [Monosporozyma servazzii]
MEEDKIDSTRLSSVEGNQNCDGIDMSEEIPEIETSLNESEAQTQRSIKSESQDNSELYNADQLRPLPPLPMDLANQLATETNKVDGMLSQLNAPKLPARKESHENIEGQDLAPVAEQGVVAPSLPPRRDLPDLPPRSSTSNVQLSQIENQAIGVEVGDEESLSLKADDMLLYRLSETINELKVTDKYISHVPGGDDDIKVNDEKLSIWEQVIKNPEGTISEKYEVIEEAIIAPESIPNELRNQIWQSVTFMKCHNWGTIYELLLPKKGNFDEDKVHEDVKKAYNDDEETSTTVFNVIKAYLNFDPEVEYNEELLAIVSLLLKQAECETVTLFGLVCTLMKYYHLREFFLNNEFNEMNKIIFEFDRMLEDCDTELYNHFLQQGIKSKMFVNEWIRSIFQKIGFEFKEQVKTIDLIIFYGFEVLLSIGCHALIFNREKLITMEYEELLVLLKDGHEIYSSTDVKLFPFNDLIEQSVSGSSLRPSLLKSYCQEYDEIYSGDNSMREEFQKMQAENKDLHESVKQLENDYTLLNREHVTIANELLQNQIKINNIQSDNSNLKLEVIEMKKKLKKQIEENKKSNAKAIPSDLKKVFDETLKKNAKVMQRNLIYQDKINELESLAVELKNANEAGIYLPHVFSQEGSKTPLIGSTWTGFKKVFK